MDQCPTLVPTKDLHLCISLNWCMFTTIQLPLGQGKTQWHNITFVISVSTTGTDLKPTVPVGVPENMGFILVRLSNNHLDGFFF